MVMMVNSTSYPGKLDEIFKIYVISPYSSNFMTIRINRSHKGGPLHKMVWGLDRPHVYVSVIFMTCA